MDSSARKHHESELQEVIACFDEMAALRTAPKIVLTNIYKEIPISYPATILEVKSDHVELSTSELQLAAIAQCKEVYVKAPYFPRPVFAHLHSIDIRRRAVRLHKFTYASMEEEKRVTLRVRFRRPISIMVYSGTERISGVIHDISIGGCCLNTFVRFPEAFTESVEVELKLIDHRTSQICCMKIPSSVIRAEGKLPPFRCALKFEHTHETEQFLALFINQRQLEILQELRETI